MGRPRAEIDKERFEKLCALQCTEAEIAGFFDCDKRTLYNWCQETYGESFIDVAERKRQNGKVNLRRNQMQLSETNATMAIWMGKQYLGQTDKPGTLEEIREAEDESAGHAHLSVKDLYG